MERSATDADLVAAMLVEAGNESYGGEAVSQLEHALQAAALAEAVGKDEEFVVACLLHDLGHLTPEARTVLDATDAGETGAVLAERQRREGADHGPVGASFLDYLASERIRWLIANHATAKRYLCTVEPGYWDRLSPVSKQTLEYQGGRMTPAEVAEVARHPWLADLVLLRRFDDEAKVPGLATPPVAHYRPMLERTIGGGGQPTAG